MPRSTMTVDDVRAMLDNSAAAEATVPVISHNPKAQNALRANNGLEPVDKVPVTDSVRFEGTSGDAGDDEGDDTRKPSAERSRQGAASQPTTQAAPHGTGGRQPAQKPTPQKPIAPPAGSTGTTESTGASEPKGE